MDLIPAHPLTAIGLFLAIVGGVIIFFWGPPQPDFQEYTALSLEQGTPLADGRTVAEHAAEVQREKRRFRRLSRIGLGLILLGFLFQLFDAWKP
jgi:hypothetical protein